MIDELLSLIQPLYTVLMIVLLGYLVYGITKRNLDYTEFPEDCTVIYKPEETKEDKYLFEHDDPWVQKNIRIPPMNINPDVNTVHEKTMMIMKHHENNVVIK